MAEKPFQKRLTIHYIILVLVCSWIPWTIVALINIDINHFISMILIGIGGAMPAIITLVYLKIFQSKAFRKDYWSRVFNFRFIKFRSSILIMLPPLYVFISVIISVLIFKRGWNQLLPTVSLINLLPFMLFTFFFGPFPEELAWRGYLLDKLIEKHTLLISSIIIGIIWGLWHIPLFFIPGYPLQEMATSELFLFTYFVSVIPKSIIMSYIYFKSNRIILTAILFHFVSNFTGMIIEIDLITELIQLIVLSIIGILLITKNRNLFLKKIINI